MTYAGNGVRGQWRAHGRYAARESAVASPSQAGFDRNTAAVDMARHLDAWQTAGDPRLWKIIVSPEFGERIDLTRLTRELMKKVSSELGDDLDWVAVAHFNTEHPHVHVALRGVGQNGRNVSLSREYVKHGIRAIAEDLCTRQLGHRTDLDAAESERREVEEKRFTSLDRLIVRSARCFADNSANTVSVTIDPGEARETDRSRSQRRHLSARLAVLQEMGLAHRAGPSSWNVRTDLEAILRAMQRTTDRQKMIAAHGVLVSDERLAIEVLDWRKTTSIEGRILVHAEDEMSGRSYLLLEGTDARIHLVDYTPDIEDARRQGRLGTNSFVQLRRIQGKGRSRIDCADFGDAEALLENTPQLQKEARGLINRGILPAEDGWGGWLGRYQKALAKAAKELEYPYFQSHRDRTRDRSKER